MIVTALLVLPLLTGWSVAYGQGGETAGVESLKLTLDDSIRLALRNNRGLLDERLLRTVQKFALEVAGDRYRPTANIVPLTRTNRDGKTGVDMVAETGLRVPTGGRITLRWSKPLAGQEDASGIASLAFSQPLLRGFGVGIDTAPLRVARLREQINILSFRQVLIGVVASTIRAWRGLVRARRQMEIGEASLQRARAQREVNLKLIEAGRMAEREVLQSDATIAGLELSLVQAQNAVTTANLRLIDVLDIDSATLIRPVDVPAGQRPVPDLEESIEKALRHSPAYAATQLNHEISVIDLKVAENDRLWGLSLDAEAFRDDDIYGRDYEVGLRLMIPLGERSPRLRAMAARSDVKRAERNLKEQRQLISIAVRQVVYDVEVGLRRIGLARRALTLAEEKLAIEQSKLQQGLSSIFQVNRFEEDLVVAQSAELDAVVGYDNALTAWHETLGTTLETWGIQVE